MPTTPKVTLLSRILDGLVAWWQDEYAAAPLREAAGITIDKDEENWRPLTGDVNRDLSPITQERMRKMALYLWESNPLANRLIELPIAFLLAEGVRLTCKDAGNQKLLDRFWKDPINSMSLKLPKKARELALYGEQCYPAFVNQVNGFVRLGYLDPSLIATVVKDPDNPEQTIGIVTVKDKHGRARRYRAIVNGPEEVFTQRTQEIRATFTDGDAFYFTVNDLSNGNRGRSDLLAQADWLDAYDEFLFGELDRWKFIRAFIWDVTLKGATQGDVEKKAKEISTPAPGSVRVHNDAEEWKAESPDVKAYESAAAARLVRNHILGGATMPEHWYGGGGDVNRAAASEMGEPTFKVYAMRQLMLKFMLEEIGAFVLRSKALAEKAGNEIDLAAEENVVTAEFPEMIVRDTTKYATALAQLVAACASAIAEGLMTKLTAVRLIGSIAQRLGMKIDAEKELTEAAKEHKDRAAADADIPTLPDADPDTGEPTSQREAAVLESAAQPSPATPEVKLDMKITLAQEPVTKRIRTPGGEYVVTTE